MNGFFPSSHLISCSLGPWHYFSSFCDCFSWMALLERFMLLFLCLHSHLQCEVIILTHIFTHHSSSTTSKVQFVCFLFFPFTSLSTKAQQGLDWGGQRKRHTSLDASYTQWRRHTEKPTHRIGPGRGPLTLAVLHLCSTTLF